MCILSVYTLLKVVGNYDLSVLSMPVMVFSKQILDGCELYSSFCYALIFIIFKFANPLIALMQVTFNLR